MGELLKKLEPRWIVLIYLLYVVSRSIRALLDPEFATQIGSSGRQFEYFEMEFSYLSLTFLHPIILAALSVELANREYPQWLFVFAVVLHWFAAVVAGIKLLLPFVNRSILDEPEAVKGVALLIGGTAVLVLSIYWWRKPVRLFGDRESLQAPPAD